MRACEGDDFIGVQCYSRVHFGPDGQAPNEPGVPVTQMGYEYWPQGVEHCARRAAAIAGVPVLLTESGIATDDDTERVTYIAEVLRGVRRALDDGVDIRGYFVWSLLDNFEWSLGFRPKFGLHSVDHRTFARTPNPARRGSARWPEPTAWWHPRPDPTARWSMADHSPGCPHFVNFPWTSSSTTSPTSSGLLREAASWASSHATNSAALPSLTSSSSAVT